MMTDTVLRSPIEHSAVIRLIDISQHTSVTTACERSVSGAGRKWGEREQSGERTFQKTLERECGRKDAIESGNGADSGLNRPLKVRSYLTFR